MKSPKRFLKSAAAIFIVALFLVGCQSLPEGFRGAVEGMLAGNQELSLETIVAGLKEALAVGTQNTVASTTQKGGYLNNPSLRIPMPEKLEGLASTLRKIGLGSQVDLFETKMNESAELAAKEAAPVFMDAIKSMTFDDAKKILNGGDTSATDFFREKTDATLKAKYQPIVTTKMQELGAVQLYQNLEQQYNRIPLVPKASVSMEDYVTEKSLDGLFFILAQEEKKIRENPAARTTALLKKVFRKQ